MEREALEAGTFSGQGKGRRLVWVAAAIAVLLQVGAVFWFLNREPSPVSLLVELDKSEQTPSTFMEEQFAKRHRWVRVNEDALEAFDQRTWEFELNLFDDEKHMVDVAAYRKHYNGAKSVVGLIENDLHTSVVLSRRDSRREAMAGSIALADGRRFMITHVSDGVHVVVEMDMTIPPPHEDHALNLQRQRGTPGGDRPEKGKGVGANDYRYGKPQTEFALRKDPEYPFLNGMGMARKMVAAAGINPSNQPFTFYGRGGSTGAAAFTQGPTSPARLLFQRTGNTEFIDVLFVYEQALLAADFNGSLANMQLKVDNLMEDTNLILKKCLIPLELRQAVLDTTNVDPLTQEPVVGQNTLFLAKARSWSGGATANIDGQAGQTIGGNVAPAWQLDSNATKPIWNSLAVAPTPRTWTTLPRLGVYSPLYETPTFGGTPDLALDWISDARNSLIYGDQYWPEPYINFPEGYQWRLLPVALDANATRNIPTYARADFSVMDYTTVENPDILHGPTDSGPYPFDVNQSAAAALRSPWGESGVEELAAGNIWVTGEQRTYIERDDGGSLIGSERLLTYPLTQFQEKPNYYLRNNEDGNATYPPVDDLVTGVIDPVTDIFTANAGFLADGIQTAFAQDAGQSLLKPLTVKWLDFNENVFARSLGGSRYTLHYTLIGANATRPFSPSGFDVNSTIDVMSKASHGLSEGDVFETNSTSIGGPNLPYYIEVIDPNRTYVRTTAGFTPAAYNTNDVMTVNSTLSGNNGDEGYDIFNFFPGAHNLFTSDRVFITEGIAGRFPAPSASTTAAANSPPVSRNMAYDVYRWDVNNVSLHRIKDTAQTPKLAHFKIDSNNSMVLDMAKTGDLYRFIGGGDSTIPPNTPPTIVTHPPADLNTTQGATATFTVNATGSSPLTYQWEENSTSPGTWTAVAGAVDSSYSLSNIQTDKNGSYRVKVSNAYGDANSTWTVLTVNPGSGGGSVPGLLVWDFLTGGPVTSSPANDPSGVVYAGSGDNKIYAIDGVTGVKTWEYDLNGSVDHAPLVDGDGTIYVGAGTRVYALDYRASLPGLMAHYPFNGNPGDVSGDYNGTLHGATSTSDRFGNANRAYGFDGNDWIELPNILANFENGTFAAWIKINTPIAGSPATIVSKPRAAGQSGLNLRVHQDPDNAQLALHNGTQFSSTGTANLEDSKWHYLVGTVDGSRTSIYVDGVLVDSDLFAAASSSSSQPLAIGRDHGPANSYFNGVIDEVRIYNRALSASEVRYLHGLDDNSTVSVRWVYDTNSTTTFSSSPAIGVDGTVYIGATDNNIYAFNGDTNATIWKYPTAGPINTSSPVIDVNGTLLFGSTDHHLYALDPTPISSVGKDLENDLNGQVHSSPVLGADGSIYIGSDDGKLYAFNSDGSSKWSFATGGMVRTTPVLGGSNVYVSSDSNKTYALDVNTGLKQWDSDTNASVWSSPTLSDDNSTLYIGGDANGTHGWVFAINTADGTKLWDFDTNASVRSKPTIGGSMVYVGSDSNRTYALNAANGAHVWNYDTGENVRSSPTLSDDNATLYIGSDSNRTYALNAATGAFIWASLDLGGFVRSTPTLNALGTTLYVGTDSNKTYALDALNGNKQWEFDANGTVRSTPRLDVNGTIYFGSGDGKIYALATNGTKIWEYSTLGPVNSSPIISSSGRLYIGSNDNNLYGLDSLAVITTPTLKWKFDANGIIYSSPAIDGNGTIYFGSADNNLYALENNGTLKWSFTTGNAVYGSPALDESGTIYFGSTDTKVYALENNGTKRWESAALGSFQSSVTIADDLTVFVGDMSGKFYALDAANNGAVKWQYSAAAAVISSPTIANNGMVYFGSNDGKVYALASTSGGMAGSLWPKYRGNRMNMGRALPEPTQGLSVYYPFTGNPNDASGNGNDGVPSGSGVSLTSDRHNVQRAAYRFDYNASAFPPTPHIETVPLSDSNSTTAVVWAKWQGDKTGAHAGESSYIFNDITGAGSAYALMVRDGGLMRFQTKRNSVTSDELDVPAASNPLADNQWHHVAVVADHVKNTKRIYIDGVARAENTSWTDGGANFDAHGKLNIGAMGNLGTQSETWNGDLDEIRFYNRALNSEEVVLLYMLEAPSFPENFPPTVVTNPQDLNSTVGSKVTFTVNVTGTAVLNYQWHKNGVPVTGGNTPSYVISSAQPDSNGSYWCVITNRQGDDNSTVATLGVAGAQTQFTSQVVSLAARTGDVASAGGTGPMPERIWFADGSPDGFRVRRANKDAIGNGVFTTIAGGGVMSLNAMSKASPDLAGLATQGRFSHIADIAVDGGDLSNDSRVFIAGETDKVFMLENNGTLTLVAGGGTLDNNGTVINALDVDLGDVISVAADKDGTNFYVADYNGSADSYHISRVDRASGNITRIIGNPSGPWDMDVNATNAALCRITNIDDIAVDDTGAIYFGDNERGIVMKKLPTGAGLVKIAGLPGSFGVAEAVDGALATTGKVAVQSIAVDALGRPYIAGKPTIIGGADHRVRRLDFNGTHYFVNTVAGGGLMNIDINGTLFASQVDLPNVTEVCIDSDLNVFFGDVNATESRIWEVNGKPDSPLPWVDGQIVYIVDYAPPPPSAPTPPPADGPDTVLAGNTYKTRIIGGRTWMAESLYTTTPDNAGSFNPPGGLNRTQYGSLYTWAAAQAAADAVPGWHIPTDQEWKELEAELGMTTASPGLNDTGANVYRGGSVTPDGVGTQLLDGGTSGMNMRFAGVRMPGGGGNFINYSGAPSGTPNAYFYVAKESGANVFRRKVTQGQTGVASYDQAQVNAISLRLIKDLPMSASTGNPTQWPALPPYPGLALPGMQDTSAPINSFGYSGPYWVNVDENPAKNPEINKFWLSSEPLDNSVAGGSRPGVNGQWAQFGTAVDQPFDFTKSVVFSGYGSFYLVEGATLDTHRLPAVGDTLDLIKTKRVDFATNDSNASIKFVGANSDDSQVDFTYHQGIAQLAGAGSLQVAPGDYDPDYSGVVGVKNGTAGALRMALNDGDKTSGATNFGGQATAAPRYGPIPDSNGTTGIHVRHDANGTFRFSTQNYLVPQDSRDARADVVCILISGGGGGVGYFYGKSARGPTSLPDLIESTTRIGDVKDGSHPNVLTNRDDICFFACAWDGSLPYYTFAHELGHNLGAHHGVGDFDKVVLNPLDFKTTGTSSLQPNITFSPFRNDRITEPDFRGGLVKDSFISLGTYFTAANSTVNRYCSIMAYGGPKGNLGVYTRVGVFSSPFVYYQGTRTGEQYGWKLPPPVGRYDMPLEFNNAQAISTIGPVASYYRDSKGTGRTQPGEVVIPTPPRGVVSASPSMVNNGPKQQPSGPIGYAPGVIPQPGVTPGGTQYAAAPGKNSGSGLGAVTNPTPPKKNSGGGLPAVTNPGGGLPAVTNPKPGGGLGGTINPAPPPVKTTPGLPNDNYESVWPAPGKKITAPQAVFPARPFVVLDSTNRGATPQDYDMPLPKTGGRSVWFRWNAPVAPRGKGLVNFSTKGSDFDTIIKVMWNGVNAGYDIQDNAKTGPWSEGTYPWKPGQSYLICVDGVGGAQGSIRVSAKLE